MTARRKAREAALQALYFADIGRAAPETALDAVFADHHPDADTATRAFATTLVGGVTGAAADLDAQIAAHSANWRFERLAVVDRLILRIAVWELTEEPDTPAPVILNEAIELARSFGGDDSARFVNGVLDAIAKGMGRT